MGVRRPVLTAKVVRGLQGVHVLVQADFDEMGSDEEWSHPWDRDDLEAAIQYINDLGKWFETQSGRGSQ